MKLKSKFSGLQEPATAAEFFAQKLLHSVIDMRLKQNNFFKLRKRNLPMSDPSVQAALNDSKTAEEYVDELITSIYEPMKKPVQYAMFDE